MRDDEQKGERAKWIRSNHPYAFRSGQWAELLTIAPSPERDCYVVRFPEDDATDFWVVDDADGEYEFADALPTQPRNPGS